MPLWRYYTLVNDILYFILTHSRLQVDISTTYFLPLISWWNLHSKANIWFCFLDQLLFGFTEVFHPTSLIKKCGDMQLLKFAFCFLNCRREWVKIIYHHHGSPNREPTGSGELSSFILVSWISKWKLKCFRRTKQLLVLQCGYSLLLWMISYISF